MQFADHSICAEIERFTKSIAWQSQFPIAETKDLVQDVQFKVWRNQDNAFQNGGIHYGYVKRCINNCIADHYKKQHIKAYRGLDLIWSDEAEGDMDCYISAQNFLNEVKVTQMLEWLIAWYNAMREGLRKDVFRYCLSEMTDSRSHQGRDIAVKLNRDQKPVSQALSYIRKKSELELL